MSQTPKRSMSIVSLRSESETFFLINTDEKITKDAQLIGEIEVRPEEQPHISLGNYNYTSSTQPKGFFIKINPNPETDSIVTQITRLGASERYELVLHIANYGSTTISAEVWRL